MRKILALVKFNDGQAIVIKKGLHFKYQRHGDLLIGMDETETFVDCPGAPRSAERILNEQLISVTAEGSETLKECYVFKRCFIVKSKLDEMLNAYTGKVYGYHEYERELQTKRRPMIERERSGA